MYYVASYICCLCLICWSVFLVIKLFSSSRKDRLEYIRSYKKGAFTVPIIPAFFLYLIGKSYAKGFSFFVIFDSLSTTLSLLGFKFETESVRSLMETCWNYKFSLHFSFFLIIVNAYLFLDSILQQRVDFWRNTSARRRKRLFSENVCFIYGYNNRSLKMYTTDDDNYCPKKYIIDAFNPAGDEDLFFRGFSYSRCFDMNEESKLVEKYLSIKEKEIERIRSTWEKSLVEKNYPDSEREKQWKEYLFKQKSKLLEFILIINFEDDDKNIELCTRLSEIVGRIHGKHNGNDEELNFILNGLNIYVFGDDELDSIYQEIEARTFGCIHYINKYKVIGTNLLLRYPVTSFMNGKQIDYSAAALKSDVRISFSMIGFGKTNRRLFSDLVSDTQFCIAGDGGYRGYAPVFYLYDKKDNLYTKDLNHNYFRYKSFRDMITEQEQDDYLPFADFPADVKPVPDCDINSPEFYSHLHETLGQSENNVNFVYIAYGTDLQNIELAKKLYDKKNEWNIANLFIFVKINSLNVGTAEFLLDEDKECLRVYGEDEEVYSFKNVISTDLYKLASYCDSIYEDVSERTDPSETRVREIRLSRKWFSSKKYEFDRLSSLAQGISIVNKLGMLGLSLGCESEGIARASFDKIYTENEKARKNLTTAEHYRWNAFMICNGYIPSTIEQIERYNPMVADQKKKRKEEEHKERRHANLTTFEGLERYKNLLSEKFRTNEPAEYDVVKFDSYLMDNCYDVVSRMGKGLVRKS